MIDTDDRGFFEEDDSAQRIWSIYDKKIDGGAGGSSSTGQRPNQRPQTSTTFRPNSLDSNTFDSPEMELEIEYPPDTFDGEREI